MERAHTIYQFLKLLMTPKSETIPITSYLLPIKYHLTFVLSLQYIPQYFAVTNRNTEMEIASP